MIFRSRQHAPKVHGQQDTAWNASVLSLCPTLTAPYSLPAWLGNGHVETIFAAWFRKKPHVLYDREVVHMPDGGCVTLDVEDLPAAQQLPDDAPVLILLPGLTGGSEDSYVQHAVVHAREAGIRAVVFNSRGTSGSPVLTAQFYSSSYTEDMRNVVAHVCSRYPRSQQLFAAGWSLGANIMCRYLGEEAERTPISAAVAMCNPFDLPLSDANFQKGFNRVYDANLARSLGAIYARHHHLFEAEAANGGRPYKAEQALKARSIREFDDAITRLSFGWPSVDAYYASSSSSLSIPHVRVPLLIIQAADDPIAPVAAIPFEAIQANPQCLLVVTPSGGHLGWCSGPTGVLGAPWTDAPVAEYFAAARQLLKQPEFAARRAAQQRQLEPAGVYTLEETTHQAP